MGILRKTEELIPITCAILPNDERESFFEELRKRANGNLQRIAKAVGTTTGVVQDWMRGRVNVPYHALQVMADEFNVPLPPVTELRREMQLVVEPPKQRFVLPPPEPAPKQERKPARSKDESRPRRERERQQPKRQSRGRKSAQEQPPRRPERGRRERPPRPQAQGEGRKPSQPKGQHRPQPTKDPKLSDRLAYWTGALLALGSVRSGVVSISADRRIGQNFAGGWASLTSEIFGIKPQLAMSEDRKVQTASFPASELEVFLARMSFKEGSEPATATGAPRWAWSNPDWKAAFLKGIVDSTAHFHRSPRIQLSGLSENLRRSAAKMLGSLGFSLKAEGDIVLEGREAVAAYLEKVGTRNMKLRDQISAYLKGRSEPSEDEAGGIAQEPQGEPAAEATSAAPAGASDPEESLEGVPGSAPRSDPEETTDAQISEAAEEDEGPDPFNR